VGIFFVTICTKNREHHFGEIADSVMHLSEIGEYAEEQLRNVKQHYSYADIPSFVVMPNHIHCIIIIWESDELNL
jgi:REP element-mobilizing transposase RayT